MRIAVVEDDTQVGQLMCLWLEEGGYGSHLYTSGSEFLKATPRESYDLVVLDWMLPDTTGDKLLQWLREHTAERVPVIFVTARDTEDDIVRGLQLGADDYITKPVRRNEFLARVQAVVRRAYATAVDPGAVLELPPYRIDPRIRSIDVAGQPVELTQKEFELAQFLFRNVGRVISRSHILEACWGMTADVNTRTVDTHMSRLRTKLALGPENGWRLSAVYNHGYRLEHIGH